MGVHGRCWTIEGGDPWEVLDYRGWGSMGAWCWVGSIAPMDPNLGWLAPYHLIPPAAAGGQLIAL